VGVFSACGLAQPPHGQSYVDGGGRARYRPTRHASIVSHIKGLTPAVTP
jgi:hypothetical protein